MSRNSRLITALIIGVATTLVGKLPLAYAELVFIPGIFVAGALGGTVHEPGALGLGGVVTIILIVSLLVWSVVAYGLLSMLVRQRAA